MGLDKLMHLAKTSTDLAFLSSWVTWGVFSVPQNVSPQWPLRRRSCGISPETVISGFRPLGALHRKNMTEASSTKIAAIPCVGLPVIQAYTDTDFPEWCGFSWNFRAWRTYCPEFREDSRIL